MTPSYIKLLKSGELDRRSQKLYQILESCTLCPRKCRINRIKGEKSICRSSLDLVVSAVHPHYGEEKPLVGTAGSGTVFLTNCNMHCVYCQNFEISQLGKGTTITPKRLAKKMLVLQSMGCHNINLVTPTHFVPQLVQTITIAARLGLTIPIVYNSGGYENVETIKLLEDIIDIYMPDIKYTDEKNARKFSDAPHYFENLKASLKEMHRQVGDLKLDKRGIAQKGLLIRHLALPNDVAGSLKSFKFIAKEISKDSYVNIMDQYRPLFRAYQYREIDRQHTFQEYSDIIKIALQVGLHRGF